MEENKEIKELTDDELNNVTGGLDISAIIRVGVKKIISNLIFNENNKDKK